MASNFLPQRQAKIAQYQNRGADYWLYGPKLKAESRGLGLQVADTMRSDITGIHENDMPYVKTLTDRVARKRGEYVEKLLDGDNVNDQFIKSMAETFNENKVIQGSIKEAKLNNQKIEQLRDWTFKMGVESGDPVYYNEWMEDSVKKWGSTFDGGKVKPFEMSQIAAYEDITADAEKVFSEVRGMMTQEQQSLEGEAWSIEMVPVNDQAGTFLGNQLVLVESTPGVLHSNKAKVDETIKNFNKRFNMSDDPKQRGQYADFLELRMRNDPGYLERKKAEVNEIRDRTMFSYVNPGEKTRTRLGRWVDAPEATPTSVPGAVSTGVISYQNVEVPQRPKNIPTSISSGTDHVVSVSEGADGLEVNYSSSSFEGGEKQLMQSANSINDALESVTNTYKVKDLQTSLVNAEKASSPMLAWAAKAYSTGEDPALKKDIQELIDDLAEFKGDDIKVTREDVLRDKKSGVIPGVTGVIKEAKDYSSSLGLFQKGVEKFAGLISDVSSSDDDAYNQVKKKEDIIKQINTIASKYEENNSGHFMVSPFHSDKLGVNKGYTERVKTNLISNFYMGLNFDNETKQIQYVGGSTDKKWKGANIDLTNPTELNGVIMALNKPGEKVGNYTVSTDFEVHSRIGDATNFMSEDAIKELGPEKVSRLSVLMDHADIITIRKHVDNDPKNDKFIKIMVAGDGPNKNPYVSMPESAHNQVGLSMGFDMNTQKEEFIPIHPSDAVMSIKDSPVNTSRKIHFDELRFVTLTKVNSGYEIKGNGIAVHGENVQPDVSKGEDQYTRYLESRKDLENFAKDLAQSAWNHKMLQYTN